MQHSHYKFTLDLQKTQSQIAIPVTRGDTARTWLISFSDGSLPYMIGDGCLAKLEIKRPTGTHIEMFCPIENRSTVKYSFSQNTNTAAVEGIHDCAVMLFDEENNIIGSPRFTMLVSNRVVNSDDINLSDEDKLIIESMIAAEASRHSAENERIASEATRTSAETQRNQNEEVRQTAENERALSEKKRNQNFETLKNEIDTASTALISPTVTVATKENGHEITLTDSKGEHVFYIANGKDGAQGPQGEQGPRGLQGPQGNSGPQGIQGEDGAPGKNGNDGKSAYQYASEFGYTGTEDEFGQDINPETLKAGLNNYIASELAKRGQIKPESAISETWINENGDRSKLYVLCDTDHANNGYIYAYMAAKADYTNLLPFSTGIDGNVYNGTGYKQGYRINSSGAEVANDNGLCCTGFLTDATGNPIAFKGGETIRIKNMTDMEVFTMYIVRYRTDKSFQTVNVFKDSFYEENGVWIGVLPTFSDECLIRFSVGSIDETTIITVNEEIKGSDVSGYRWASTGHYITPLSTVYEERLNSAEQTIKEHTTKLKSIQGNKSEIPSYWLEELKDKSSAIQNAMETAGRNKSAFLWYTDAHWQTNSKRSPSLLKYLIENTPMNKVNFGGDIINDPNPHTHENIRYVYDWRNRISDLPNHHSVFGNHDVNHRTTDVSRMAYAYILAHEETSDMVVGGDSFYYIDNTAEKTRYLYLSYLTNNSSEMTAQGNFIVDTLSSVPNGWHVVVIAHRWYQYNNISAPTVGYIPEYESTILNLFDTYNARGKISNSVIDFAGAKGKVEFCIGGHIHVDHNFTTSGGIPVILTASDTNQERSSDETEDSGALGTITESAIFGIVANYNTRTITIVGVGRGTSREINY